MEIKQETKSLPRNRKCGNCRYFEPAPLWRKGWCRNARLYDRRANHLVDAATIDCEQVFRARIYWEPIPLSDVPENTTGYSPFVENASADSGLSEGNKNSRVPSDGVLRPRNLANNVPAVPQNNSGLPVITRREKAAASPGLVAKPNRTRNWLIENIPYYDRIDGPLSRINYLRLLPWIIVVALLLLLVLNVFGAKKETPNATGNPQDSTASSLLSTSPVPTTPVVVTSKNASPTPTLSNVVPTATPAPTPTPTPKAVQTTAKVVKSGNGLNMRKDPGTGAAKVAQIPDGATVTIRSGDFRTVDGITWWPISYQGKDGWAASDYLEKQNP
ncbi:MAG TPA: SH3 domain-containing protein [Chloroflexia bacterium]|nr:SH3 domain-containing protein [Chloroflexia bacterium]